MKKKLFFSQGTPPPLLLDQVFPETSGFLTLESKIYVSKDNPQKAMGGVRSHSKNSTETSLLPKVSGFINHGNGIFILKIISKYFPVG